MRAKMILDTNLDPKLLRALFPEFDKSQVWDLDDAAGKEALELVLETVAEEDQDKARSGALFAFYHPLHESQGFVSIEDGHTVIRARNEGIVSLRETCERLVQYLADYCRRNKKTISFPRPVSILELRHRRPIIDGRILVLPKDRWKEAKRQKLIELVVSVVGLCVALLLAAATLYGAWRWQGGIDKRPWYVAWAYDILSKLFGSVAITTILAGVNFLVTLNHLQAFTIQWTIPGTDSGA